MSDHPKGLEALREAERLHLEDRHKEALEQVRLALLSNPTCYDSLVLAGELHCQYAPELGLSDSDGDQMSIDYFDRAIEAQPSYAEAYAEKALALLHLTRYAEAIACVDEGMTHLGDEPAGTSGEIWVNIAESFYRIKALALLESGRREEGRKVLDEGLRRFPNSRYLAQIVDDFVEDDAPTDGDR